MLVNFRKVKLSRPNHLHIHTLYRSGTFSYATDDEIYNLKNECKTKYYVDLRSEQEALLYPAPKLMQKCDIKWYHTPLNDTEHHLRKNPAPSSNDYFEFYKYIYNKNQTSLIHIIGKLYTQLKESPTIVGCFAGKDRTGVVVMLLLYLMEVNFTDIIEDYCETTMHLTNRIDCFKPHWIKKNITKDQYKTRLIARAETAEKFLSFISNDSNKTKLGELKNILEH